MSVPGPKPVMGAASQDVAEGGKPTVRFQACAS
jgi:hypothetical protein